MDNKLKVPSPAKKGYTGNKLTPEIVAFIKECLAVPGIKYKQIADLTGITIYYIKKIEAGDDVLQTIEENRKRLQEMGRRTKKPYIPRPVPNHLQFKWQSIQAS